jgi:hypothetical protein
MKERKPVSPDLPSDELPQADQTTLKPAMRTVTATRRTDVRLGRDAQIRIGQQLRAFYDDVVNEGVPDHIADLVRKLTDQDDEGPRE